MNHRIARSSIALAALLAVCGCRSEVVPVELNFPNESTFLFTRWVRLAAFPVAENERSACSSLLASTETGDFTGAVFDSELQHPCMFYNSEVIAENIPDGPHAFAAIAYDRDSATVMLSGCVVEDVRSSRAVHIDMNTSSYYDDMYATLTPSCMVATRCDGSCENE